MTTSQNLLIRQPLLVQHANLATQLFSNPSHLLLSSKIGISRLVTARRSKPKRYLHLSKYHFPQSCVLENSFQIPRTNIFQPKNTPNLQNHLFRNHFSNSARYSPFLLLLVELPPFRTGGCRVMCVTFCCHPLSSTPLQSTLFTWKASHLAPSGAIFKSFSCCHLNYFLWRHSLLNTKLTQNTQSELFISQRRDEMSQSLPVDAAHQRQWWHFTPNKLSSRTSRKTSGNITTSLLVTTFPEGALWSPLSYSRCCAQLLLCLMPIIIGFTRTQLNTAARTPFDVTLANSSSLYSYASVFPPCSRTRLSSAVTNQLNSEHTLCAS